MKLFLTGLATGVAIAYLTAPRSGKESRVTLLAKAGKQVDAVKGQVNKTVDRATETMDHLKSQSGVFAQKTEQARNENVDQLATQADQGTEQAKCSLKPQ